MKEYKIEKNYDCEIVTAYSIHGGEGEHMKFSGGKARRNETSNETSMWVRG
jgi:hypothetical protein